MPVRIYDIAKKLGIESKEVLARAKDLGISAARVPSSSLDKITAEYLEEQLSGGRPVAVAPPPPHEPGPIVLVTAPAPPPETAPAPLEEVEAAAPAPATEISVPAPLALVEEAPASAPSPETEPSFVPAAEETAVASPAPAAPPAGPKTGDKVGFIQLPTRISRDRGASSPPPRGNVPAQTELIRNRPDNRGTRPAPQAPGRTPFSSGRPGQFQRPRQPGIPIKPPPPAAPKFTPPDTDQIIKVKPPIIVRDLAEQLKRKPFQLIADLIDLKVMATVNQAIDESIAQQICAKYGFRFEVEKRERGGGTVHAPVRVPELDVEDKPEEMIRRAPVVTIMGHVDHGKTTLLDVIRKANVAAGESGGITQHIGAYTIAVPHPERPQEMAQITFLDTPGHAAFSAMRARGANVTDIVILVVAANDGVMPQTLEALSHAQAARVPIIVAVNKCDHPNANPLKTRKQLQERGLVADDWGGDTIFVDVSAVTRQGVDKLLEMVLFQADLIDLKANPNRRAKGNVIESGLEPGGPTATVLVRKGTLRIGDIVICGAYWGKVRALINEEGARLKEAGPSVAVRLLGLDGVPEAGIEFSAVESEKNARTLAEKRELESRESDKEQPSKATLEDLFGKLDASATKTLKIVVKGDTQGSVEAIVEALKKIESTDVSLQIIHSAVGTITKYDVNLASVDHAVILGFHTRIDNGVSELAKREGVQIKLYAIIYELIDQVKEGLAGLLPPILREVVIGSAEVRKLFELSKGGVVAGCVVTNGRVVKGKVRIMRRKSLVYEGIALSLRRFQDEVTEVRSGMECGIRIDGFSEFQLGDTIETYTVEKVAQKL